MRTCTITIIFIIFILNDSQAQKIDYIQDPYYECLKIYIQSLKKIDVISKGDTLLVSQRDYISNFEGSYEGVHIKMIPSKLLNKLTKNGATIRIIVLNPIQFENGYLTINIVNFGTSRKRKHYTLINNGHQKIKMEHDCKKEKYRFEIMEFH